MDWFAIGNIVIPIAGMATGLIVMSGIYRLASKALDGRFKQVGQSQFAERVEQLEAEVERLREENSAQLEELHERLDFAERILANPDGKGNLD